jgi:hypothetical protein
MPRRLGGAGGAKLPEERENASKSPQSEAKGGRGERAEGEAN